MQEGTSLSKIIWGDFWIKIIAVHVYKGNISWAFTVAKFFMDTIMMVWITCAEFNYLNHFSDEWHISTLG